VNLKRNKYYKWNPSEGHLHILNCIFTMKRRVNDLYVGNYSYCILNILRTKWIGDRNTYNDGRIIPLIEKCGYDLDSIEITEEEYYSLLNNAK
jgi:hypothetical protein